MSPDGDEEGQTFPDGSGFLDATSRHTLPNGNALKVLQDYADQAEAEAGAGPTAPPGAPRKHYAGTFKDGRFEKTRASRVEDLTEAERQELIAEMEADRRRKVEELVRRQKKHASKHRKNQRREVQQLQGSLEDREQWSDVNRGKNAHELKKWLKQKDEESKARRQKEAEAMARVKAQFNMQAEMVHKYERANAENRERRLRIAEKRRTAIEEAMSMRGGVGTAPVPPTVGMFYPQAQRMLHRHVHHHMHYHSGGQGGDEDNMRVRTSDDMSAQLPAVAPPPGHGLIGPPPKGVPGIAPSLRRSLSDTSSFNAVPTQRKQRSVSSSASASKIPPGLNYQTNFQAAAGAYGGHAPRA